MGIADAIAPKIHQIGPGLPVAGALCDEGVIGFTQVSELLGHDGIDFVAPLPPEVQHITIWSAGLHVAAQARDPARALMDFLTAPEAAEVFAHCGMQAG